VSTDKYLKELEGPPAPRLAIAIIGILVVGTLILFIIQLFRRPVSILRSNEVLQAARQASPGDLTVIVKDDVTVYLPSNSINREGAISIAPPESGLFEVADDTEWIRPRIVLIQFLNPEGTPVPNISFFHPIEVCFNLTQEQWQSLSSDPGMYQIQYYAEQGNPPRWEILPKLAYPDKLQLCGQTYHLSVFALAIKVPPEIPITGPTATPTPTPTSTRTILEPYPTREREPRPTATKPSPTSPPTQPPPTQPSPTQPPPTQPPPTQPPPTEPPPTEPPTEPPTQPPIIPLPTLPIPLTLPPILP
jgi:hypothetical protein